MPERVQLAGTIEGHALRVQHLSAVLRGWPDGDVVVTIARRRARRSAAQNDYYRGVVLAVLAGHTGYSPDEMHAYLRDRFNGHTMLVTDRDGVIVDERRVAQSTTTLSTKQFSDYLEAIRLWALEELGVIIPEADTAWAKKKGAA